MSGRGRPKVWFESSEKAIAKKKAKELGVALWKVDFASGRKVRKHSKFYVGEKLPETTTASSKVTNIVRM